MQIMRSFAKLGCAVALVVTLGCGPKVSQDNYDKLKADMTKSEVEDILGKPTETQAAGVGGMSMGEMIWKDGNKTITVTFLNDKVTMFTKTGF